MAKEQYRLAEERDLASIVDMLGDPEVGRWLWFTPGTPEFFQQYFRPLIDAQTGEGAEPDSAEFVVENAAGEYLGMGAAMPVPGSPGGFEIGFQLARAAWGRGVVAFLSDCV